MDRRQHARHVPLAREPVTRLKREGKNMTGKQWNAKKKLVTSMEDYLVSYGWKQLDDKHWSHVNFARGEMPFQMLDAVAQTMANPHIGWATT